MSGSGGAEPDARTRRRLASMARVRQAALRLIGPDNYAEVSVELIAAEAGIAPATIYRHFGSKDRIIAFSVVSVLTPDYLQARLDAADLPEILVSLAGAIDALPEDEQHALRHRIRLSQQVAELRGEVLRELSIGAGIIARALEHDVPVRPEHARLAIGMSGAAALQTAADQWALEGADDALLTLTRQSLEGIEQVFLQ